ncbi:MAG: hypothetical protein LBP20_04420 [Treponema sp.]|jgi:hypothetical protein|nr:hypothetical protein [Treponema sp.]
MNSITDGYQIKFNPKGNKVMATLGLMAGLVVLVSTLAVNFSFLSLIVAILLCCGSFSSFFSYYTFDKNYCTMHWFSFVWKIPTMSISAVVCHNWGTYFFYFNDGSKAGKAWMMAAFFEHSKVKKICAFIQSVNPYCVVEI